MSTDFIKELDKLEEAYEKELDEGTENKEVVIANLLDMHMGFEDDESINRFLVQAAGRFGGVYIPYLFWDKLSVFLDEPAERVYLHQLIQYFGDSDFEEDEQRKMKPLLIVYLAKERPFEIDKLIAQVIEKAHPEVQEYFHKLQSFVEKNERSTEMYVEKFELLRDVEPDFRLLNLPLTKLKEKLQEA